MKNILLLFAALFMMTLVSALPGEESIYEGPVVSYSVEKGSGEVLLTLNMVDPSQFEEIKIVRSDNPVSYFRQIKYIGANDISQLTGADIIVDKYPLPSNTNSFYKVITIDRSGVQRSYPSVKLAKL